MGLDHETVRVPYRRAGRPEIEELTRQRRVPVLVDGDEIVHDSKRIIEYLEWRHGRKASAEAESGEVAGSGG
jgi:glutathione S-transferase